MKERMQEIACVFTCICTTSPSNHQKVSGYVYWKPDAEESALSVFALLCFLFHRWISTLALVLMHHSGSLLTSTNKQLQIHMAKHGEDIPKHL